MATEIERKFLVHKNLLPDLQDGQAIVQGYLNTTADLTLRVRLMGDQAFLTLKSKAVGISRLEFEYPIPLVDAETILKEMCPGPKIEKTRYCIPFAGHVWELDVFDGSNSGLMIAEVELASELEQPQLPCWIGEEVSFDPKYFNSSLMKHPFLSWPRL